MSKYQDSFFENRWCMMPRSLNECHIFGNLPSYIVAGKVRMGCGVAVRGERGMKGEEKFSDLRCKVCHDTFWKVCSFVPPVWAKRAAGIEQIGITTASPSNSYIRIECRLSLDVFVCCSLSTRSEHWRAIRRVYCPIYQLNDDNSLRTHALQDLSRPNSTQNQAQALPGFMNRIPVCYNSLYRALLYNVFVLFAKLESFDVQGTLLRVTDVRFLLCTILSYKYSLHMQHISRVEVGLTALLDAARHSHPHHLSNP